MKRGARKAGRTNQALYIGRVVTDFQRSEESSSYRKGTFEIDKPFDQALNTVPRAGPEKTEPKSR